MKLLKQLERKLPADEILTDKKLMFARWRGWLFIPLYESICVGFLKVTRAFPMFSMGFWMNTILFAIHFFIIMKYAISARWLSYPNHGYRHFRYNYWSLHEYLIYCQKQMKILQIVKWPHRSPPLIMFTIESRMVIPLWACSPILLHIYLLGV